MDFIDDMVITGTIKTKLAEDQSMDATDINVDTTNGVVTLSGTVDSENAKRQAQLITMGVEGVLDVIDDLEVSKQ